MTIVVVSVDVGSGEPYCDVVRSITGVVIRGTEEVPTPIRSGRSSLEEKDETLLAKNSLWVSTATSTTSTSSSRYIWCSSRYKSVGVSKTQGLSPTDSLIQDDSILVEQVHLSDDEDSGNDHSPKADSRKNWWKPLSDEERPAILKHAWNIPSSTISDVKNNWATWYVFN
nr:hypothetical protein [Tanacetum cinerariifolium]